ncbi:MAG: M20/M25/M40 family metallo-hydrolase [Galactobacter sp.]|uniref:M20/M25/M40 family metallo-hydrolase n=1 Tax=Galactobacter sp. TaxID=2676125 RepID=UPI0025BB52F3|nr:M20/M25/M40 family metallo-hydrolase [Galactobacter sp.]
MCPAPTGTVTTDPVALAAELIRIDTTNFGGGRSNGERAAADYVEAFLGRLGVECTRYEVADGRTNLIARVLGQDPELPALMLNAHLDVVPADPQEWSVDPFAGLVRDGFLWGRGAVDMKGMVGMILAAVASLLSSGQRPRRDLVLAFLADEEDNSHVGARWMVSEHPEAFEGVAETIGEVGGFSVDIEGRPVFLVQTGEKGILWLRLRAHGRGSHGSQINRDESALLDLAQAVLRIGHEPWEVSLTETTSAMLSGLAGLLGLPEDSDPDTLARATGACSTFVTPGLRTVANPTLFHAGIKENTVPSTAEALVDVRFLPGQRDEVLSRIKELAGPGIEVEIADEVEAVETSFDTALVETMRASVERALPGATLLPYLVPAGTDNPMFARLGIRGFGFSPLLLPPGFDFPAMFHGVDERVPVDALRFGAGVLHDLVLHH